MIHTLATIVLGLIKCANVMCANHHALVQYVIVPTIYKAWLLPSLCSSLKIAYFIFSYAISKHLSSFLSNSLVSLATFRYFIMGIITNGKQAGLQYNFAELFFCPSPQQQFLITTEPLTMSSIFPNKDPWFLLSFYLFSILNNICMCACVLIHLHRSCVNSM